MELFDKTQVDEPVEREKYIGTAILLLPAVKEKIAQLSFKLSGKLGRAVSQNELYREGMDLVLDKYKDVV